MSPLAEGGADLADAPTYERLRAERDRLATDLRAADLDRIRLRDALDVALRNWARCTQEPTEDGIQIAGMRERWLK